MKHKGEMMGFNSMRVWLVLALLFISVGTASGAMGGKEFQITNVVGVQKYAYTHDNKIVWEDKRDAGTNWWDIYVYDLGPDGVFNTGDDGGERPVANRSQLNEYYPDIYGDLITFAVTNVSNIGTAAATYANTSIFLFNLSSNVTADLIPGDPYYQCCPQLSDITISWYDYRNGNMDIYVYDIGPDGVYGTADDGGEFQVTDELVKQKPQFIWGRNLVWIDYRNGNGDAYLYDAGPDGRFNTSDDRGEFQVTSDPANQNVWDVREHMIVWADRRNWSDSRWDIYGYDMGPDGAFNTSDDRGEFRVTDEDAYQEKPIVYSNIIAWKDNRSGNTDVYIYDLGPDEIFNTSDDGGEYALVTNSYNQERIEMYNGKIVYDDRRDGDLDIYMYDLAPQIVPDSPLMDAIYNQTQIWANVTLNENAGWCGYSLNGAVNLTMSNDSLTHFYASVSVPGGYNNITFSCNDTVGSMSSRTVYFTVDTTPPSNVTTTVIQRNDYKFNVTWTTATDNETGIKEYNIYQLVNGDELTVLFGAPANYTQPYVAGPGYNDSNLYQYKVTAVDHAGNEGNGTYTPEGPVPPIPFAPLGTILTLSSGLVAYMHYRRRT